MKQPLVTLQARGRPALQNDRLVEFAKTNSPSATYDLVLSDTGDRDAAIAARWLSVLRRDYGEAAFADFVKT